MIAIMVVLVTYIEVFMMFILLLVWKDKTAVLEFEEFDRAKRAAEDVKSTHTCVTSHIFRKD